MENLIPLIDLLKNDLGNSFKIDKERFKKILYFNYAIISFNG